MNFSFPKWRKGRQSVASYEVLDLWKFHFPFSQRGCDGYILRYRGPDKLPLHRDKVDEGLKHYRLNLIFGAKGDFTLDDRDPAIINWRGRVILFRPDIQYHGMNLDKGRRYVFSIGLAI